ncbi:autorepressor SdpR family transcription factor [Dellaglioa sp. BT-FLS60]
MSLQNTLKALSNPVRRDILMLLKKKRLSAGEISAQFTLSQATISNHLKVLRQGDLIRETKYKNFIYYELNLSVFEDAMLWLQDLTKGENNEK